MAARELALDGQALRSAGIGFAPVQRERKASDLSFPGTVAIPPAQLRVVAAPVEGLIEAVEVAPDELVTAGQTIIRMRSPALVEAQRAYLAAEADAALARDRLRRSEQLFAARALPERDLRVAENDARTATYHVNERRHVLTLMGMTEQEVETLQRTRAFRPTIDIPAPKAGIVLSRHTSPGARVAPAEPLFTIAQLDPLWVNLQVPSSRLASIELGSPVSLPGQGATGHILRIGRSVDPATQSVTAVAQIDTRNGSVRPGLAVIVRVRVEQTGGAQWVVPAGSVVRHRDQSWVFVRKPDGVRAVPVEVLSENSRDASIKADLEADDLVANRGLIPLLAELAKTDSD
ncbi:efflux RND transporter periplasmic adaptor subunit [Reyranella sp.]|uniref:efflux RND transporter periplasmic adaptor subunit n=1 Tax=Reyranella sp. TaxID=1929291 RepID=UPI003D0D979C